MARRGVRAPREVSAMLWDILIALLIVCLVVFLIRRV